MKNRPYYERLGFAFAGLRDGWRREPSFRLHIVCMILVAAVLVIVRPAPIWWALASLIIGMILALELINSALETLIDHLHPDIHPEIRVVKDMASAAVLITGAAALAIAVAFIVSLF